jgi:hypothetical protein
MVTCRWGMAERNFITDGGRRAVNEWENE